MEILTIKHSNGHSTTYVLIPDGNDLPVAYYVGTPAELIKQMERLRKSSTRIKIYYGDPKTGKCWQQEFDKTGYIGLSRGDKARFPILVYNHRSMGGGSIMTDCILKIVSSTKKQSVFYCAENFIAPQVEVKPSQDAERPFNVHIDGLLYGCCKTASEAKRLATKMS